MNLPPSSLICSYHRIDPVESCAIWEHVQGLFWFAVGGDIAWLKYVVFYEQYTVYDSDLQDDHFELHLLCVEIFLRFWIFETQKIIPIKSICFCDVTMENSPQRVRSNMLHVAITDHCHVVKMQTVLTMYFSISLAKTTNAHLMYYQYVCKSQLVWRSSMKIRFMNQGENVFSGYRPISNKNFWF